MLEQISNSESMALARTNYSELDERINQQPLAIIINPSEDISVLAGESFELRVTVTNQGHIGAVINIYIDETSGVIRQWCDSAYESLALAHNCSSEVVFKFSIPANATPNTYNYLLVIDAPKHYPEHTPIRHQAKLQVLPPVQASVRINDPTFVVQPTTSVSKPTTIQPGEPFDIKVAVNNRSDRVDRFRLTCTDISPDWFTVIYPEGLVDLGLVIENDSLSLNPGAKGEIWLRFQLPLDIKAGNYSPTIRLTSVNNLHLVLMDVVYLQVLPTNKLTAELQVVVDRVKRDPALFRLLLTNFGNTVRELAVSAKENSEQTLCNYTFTPEQVKIVAKQTTQIDLRVQPNKWWRRPWFGKGLPIEFYIELEDTYQLPVSPERIEGNLVWQPRPWWQLLLLILTGAGAIATLVFLIWWLFFRPPAAPKILEFVSSSPSYQEATGDAIYLNWQLRHPQQLKTMRIVGLSAEDGVVLSPAVTYDFSQGIPSQLKGLCTLQQILICQNVRTDARKAGNYIFQMEILSRSGETVASTLKTNTIKINPLPLPKIVALQSTQPIYQQTGNKDGSVVNPTISLNWKIVNSQQLQELRLIGRAADGTVNSTLKTYNFRQGIPVELTRFCILQAELVCRNVTTDAQKPGDYIFELSAVTKRDTGEEINSQKTDLIKIQPYQLPVNIVSFKINGQEALPKYVITLSPTDKAKNLTLYWQVTGDKNTKVELLPAPGNVPLSGVVFYPMSQQPGTENITLRVTSASGQQITRSVAIEKVVPRPIEPPTTGLRNSAPAPTMTKPPSDKVRGSASPSNLPSPPMKPTVPPRATAQPSAVNPTVSPRATAQPSAVNPTVSPQPTLPSLVVPPAPAQPPAVPASPTVLEPSSSPSSIPIAPEPATISPTPEFTITPTPIPSPLLPKPPSPVEVPPQF